MRACRIFFLICVTLVLTRTTSAGGPCERIENEDWYDSIGTLKICFMDATAIETKDFSITSDRDVTVEGFTTWDNKNLKYLPNNLGAKFPNLVALTAAECSIKEISKHNFEGLGKLRHLSLYDNQIEKIDDDTFDGIPAVEEIILDYNMIKKLNGRAFASLHKLTKVCLNGNLCINEYFDTPERIAEMYRTISEKCGFTVECNIETCLSEKSKLEAALKIQQEEVSSLKSRNKLLESEKTQIESLNNESNAQLLLVLVAALIAVAVLLGAFIALIKRRQTNNTNVAFRSIN